MICTHMKPNALLESEVCGIQIISVLMYKNPLHTLQSFNLLKYELIFTEQ